MLTVSPYNKWPLRVKLYAKEVVKVWDQIDPLAPPLPPGYSHTVELEGVDGKSGVTGRGRTGPIDVTDSEWQQHSSLGLVLMRGVFRSLYCRTSLQVP